MYTVQRVRMTDGSEKIRLDSPYHPDLPERARKLGGKWNATAKAWLFDPRDEERVRELAVDVYGRPDEPTVTVRYKLGSCWNPDVFLFGRELARRPGRDSKVVLGTGVIVLSGDFPASGGSAKHPALASTADTVLEIRDVPESKARAAAGPDVEIVDAPAPADPAVSAERQIRALWATLSAERKAALLKQLGV